MRASRWKRRTTWWWSVVSPWHAARHVAAEGGWTDDTRHDSRLASLSPPRRRRYERLAQHVLTGRHLQSHIPFLYVFTSACVRRDRGGEREERNYPGIAVCVRTENLYITT